MRYRLRGTFTDFFTIAFLSIISPFCLVSDECQYAEDDIKSEYEYVYQRDIHDRNAAPVDEDHERASHEKEAYDDRCREL